MIHAAAKEYPKEESEAIVKDRRNVFKTDANHLLYQDKSCSALIGTVEVIDIVTCEELQERKRSEIRTVKSSIRSFLRFFCLSLSLSFSNAL